MRPRLPHLCLGAMLAALSLQPVAVIAGPPQTTTAPAKAPAAAANSEAARLAALPAVIDKLLEAKVLANAQVSVRVYDLESGRELYARNPDLALNPASNVKLLTTAAALSLLGPDHRYPTRVYVKKGGLDADGTVRGDLYLRGGGDPALVTGDLYELAQRLRAAGVKKVRGRVLVDSSRFDGDGLPPGFDQKNEFAAYRAPFGATAVNFDTYELRFAEGAKVGESVRARVVPPVKGIELDNQAKIVAGKKNTLTVSVEERKGKSVVKLGGTLGVDASRPSYRYPVSNPSTYAGQVFTLVLGQAGIKVDKRSPGAGKVPARAKLLGTHRSEPLSVLIRSVNKFSNNFMAEQILRTMDAGEGASAADSLQALRDYASDQGLGDGLVLGNGSGLYDNNRVSAGAITRLLSGVYNDFRVRADFLASLAVMGVDGTARRRLKDDSARGWVRVKTGTLDGISALSGFAGTRARRPVAFSVLFNGLERYKTPAAREVQDGIVAAIIDAIEDPRGEESR